VVVSLDFSFINVVLNLNSKVRQFLCSLQGSSCNSSTLGLNLELSSKRDFLKHKLNYLSLIYRGRWFRSENRLKDNILIICRLINPVSLTMGVYV
jgi:hypothetical protein